MRIEAPVQRVFSMCSRYTQHHQMLLTSTQDQSRLFSERTRNVNRFECSINALIEPGEEVARGSGEVVSRERLYFRFGLICSPYRVAGVEIPYRSLRSRSVKKLRQRPIASMFSLCISQVIRISAESKSPTRRNRRERSWRGHKAGVKNSPGGRFDQNEHSGMQSAMANTRPTTMVQISDRFSTIIRWPFDI